MESNGALVDIDTRNRSVVYTRWGSKSCPSGADMVLSGNRIFFLPNFYKLLMLAYLPSFSRRYVAYLQANGPKNVNNHSINMN